MQPDSNSFAICAHDITKRFGSKRVLQGIHLEVPRGQIYGLSGPNGAGKSLFLRILCGLVRPDGGEVRILGKRIGADSDFPPSTGALIDSPGFLAGRSGYANLELLAAIGGRIGRAEIVAALQQVGLDPEDRSPVRTYSNGMRQRLGIAQAIMEKPDVLILDEPTDAIDQGGWRNVYAHLVEMKEGGAAILLASNNLDEIRILCDRAFVMEGGKLFESQA
ncbi:MAG: ABC transporter ATP-binding protein [Chloroflexi bacterium]|nr:ABC transporter ATP-binding protein [Anaerolineaceae bacterium]NMB88708.1 ABC transporter ATP-binding protein [Chloroflexota bacterium]